MSNRNDREIFTSKDGKPVKPKESLPADVGKPVDEFTGGPSIDVNLDTGKMFVPGVGEVDLVGVGTGPQLERLKAAKETWQRDKAAVQALMKAMWICTQCKQVQKGTTVRVKLAKIHGQQAVIFVCVKKSCDAPVVMLRGATGQGLLQTSDGGQGLVIPKGGY